jgi:hypothetical protein
MDNRKPIEEQISANARKRFLAMPTEKAIALIATAFKISEDEANHILTNLMLVDFDPDKN